MTPLCSISWFSNWPGGTGGTPTFCVSSIQDISIIGWSGSVETAVKGRAFTIALTSAMNVTKSSCVSFAGLLQEYGIQDTLGNQSCAPGTLPYVKHVED